MAPRYRVTLTKEQRQYLDDMMVPLFELSEKTSEQIFALQDQLESCLAVILADPKNLMCKCGGKK